MAIATAEPHDIWHYLRYASPGNAATISAIARRELAGYFQTPVAYVFIVIFLVMAGALTFYGGNFFERGQADLEPFFSFHPWLYLFLIPALAMRLWAEDRKSGAIELLLTLPVTVTEAVVGKFLAAWAFTGVALAGTVPLWFTVNSLGHPDNGVIFAGYIGSFLMAGGFLAIGSACSALTKSQVIAFVISAAVCFLFIALGTHLIMAPIQNALPAGLVQSIAALSVLDHFANITRGQVSLSDLIYFGSMIWLFLFATTQFVELTKAD
jgi:ABC-2 type transport system permease protein